LPFDIFVQGKRAWITVNNSSDSTLTPGSDLLEINQVACSNIITAGLNWWNGDGYQVTWKEFFLNEYDFFEDVCWAVFNLEGPYHLKIKDVQGNIRSVTVTNQPAKIARSPSANQNLTSEQQEKARKSKYLHLKLLHDSVTAVLTVNGLEYGDEEYYQQYFYSLNKSKIKNLILDVRRNPGGDVRIISSLMSYLADSSYQIIKKIIAKKPDPTQNNYTAYFNPSITRSHKAGYLTGQKEGNWYAIGTSAEIGKIIGYTPKAKKDNFKGNLYVLIGGGTFSNAANFTAALKVYRKNVVFIGSETGGTELGCGGGTNQELTLPHSKVVVTIPLMRLISASSNPKDGRGLIPDVEVLYTPEAITQKQDLELEKALQIIDSRSTSGK
jgi:C-terminal processing protease CtpA/Prc